MVRLVYGKQSPQDTDADNRYTRAKRDLEAWQRERILVQDAAPALYLYEHTFTFQGESFRRLGVVALLELNDSTREQVLRHEATFSAPKADRTQLLQAVRANLSPVFCIAPDAGGRGLALTDRLSRELPPVASCALGEEAARVWAVTDPAAIQELQELIGSSPVLIADGHHRFEVAWAHRQMSGAVMTYFSWLGDPAVRVRPIHRVMVVPAEAQQGFASRLDACVKRYPCRSVEELFTRLDQSSEPGCFGFYGNGVFSLVRLREAVRSAWHQQRAVPPALADLDVVLLHRALVPRLVEDTAEHDRLFRYTPDPAEALAGIARGEGTCAWFVRPIPLKQVYELASNGLTLPQKTTYFYPKLLSGLFINPFNGSAA